MWWIPVLGFFAVLAVLARIVDRRDLKRGSTIAGSRAIRGAIREDRRDLRAYRGFKNVRGPGTDWMARKRR